jgi:hypothetical protein
MKVKGLLQIYQKKNKSYQFTINLWNYKLVKFKQAISFGGLSDFRRKFIN